MIKTTAFDSWEKNGAIGIRDSSGGIVVSDDVRELLKFLRYAGPQTIRVTWDIDQFVAPIIRLLTHDDLDRLAKVDESLVVAGNELYYSRGRIFRCGKARYYGLREFWPTSFTPPTNCAQTLELSSELVTALEKIGLSEIRKLTSPIAVFEDSPQGRQLYDSIPKGLDVPRPFQDVLEMASHADQKDWVSNYSIGHYPAGSIHDYDISACYAGIAARLPDLRDLQFWRSKTLGNKEMSAIIGIARGTMTLDPNAAYSHCSPIIFKDRDKTYTDPDTGSENSLPTNPLGKLPEDCYTLGEVRFVLDNDLGHFDFKEGVFASPMNGVRPRLPFKEFMDTMYFKRSISPLASSASKGITNSLIGKLIETRITGEYGPLRNDLYHAIITAAARIQIARFLVTNEITPDELVAVQTDGVRLTRRIPLPSTKTMGTWRYNGSDPVLAFSPYRIFTGTKRPYSMTIEDVTRMITANPSASIYEKPNKRRLTLKMAAQMGDLYRVGELVNSPSTLELFNLDYQQNRLYHTLPETGSELLSGTIYRSSPVIID